MNNIINELPSLLGNKSFEATINQIQILDEMTKVNLSETENTISNINKQLDEIDAMIKDLKIHRIISNNV